MLNISCIDIPIKPKIINLIISGGGGIGGMWGLGTLYYIKKLEKLNIIKISTISGSSIGSILGAHYLNNSLEEFEQILRSAIKYVRTHKSYKNLKKIIFNNKTKFNLNKLNNKLLVRYIHDGKYTIQKHFDSNDALMTALYNSSYIPFLLEDKLFNDNCCDAMFPFIFIENLNKTHDSLYIKLEINSLIRKKEYEIEKTINSGMAEANSFFYFNKSNKLSFISKWHYSQFFLHRLKEFILIICYLLLKKYNSSTFKNYVPFQINNCFKNIFLDTTKLLAFS
jgi:hypothetical protein